MAYLENKMYKVYNILVNILLEHYVILKKLMAYLDELCNLTTIVNCLWLLTKQK